MPLIPALRRQSQVDFCEFKANLVCNMNSSCLNKNPGSDIGVNAEDQRSREASH